jgi:hypothetical protein
LFNAALRTPERALARLNFSREHREEAQMPAILIPVLGLVVPWFFWAAVGT